MRLFYLKEKPTTPLRHGGKTMKKHIIQWKNLFIRIFLLKWKLLKHLWERKKIGKSYTRCCTLGWEIAVSLPLRKRKLRIKKERPEAKCLESSRADFDSIFMLITFSKKLIIQITWNTILYPWHPSPAINYGKLLILLIFPASTSFSFFFWFVPDDSLRENNKTLTAPLSLMNPF